MLDFGVHYAETQADWATTRAAFDSNLRKYPNARNMNGKAMFACAANDAETFNATMHELGDNVIPDSWFIPFVYCKSRVTSVTPYSSP